MVILCGQYLINFFIEMFLSLSSRTPEEWKDCFENACRNLFSLEANLPVLKREAFQELVSKCLITLSMVHCINPHWDAYRDKEMKLSLNLKLIVCFWNTSCNKSFY